MGNLVKAAKASDVPQGQARVVDLEGRQVALFNVAGEFYALDNACPHSGGPLGLGALDGSTVTCPWHFWEWSVKDGSCVSHPAAGKKAAVYPVRVRDGDVFVEL